MLHLKLLTQMVGHFYEAKRREQIQRQLPQITQRLGATLDKLPTPQQQSDATRGGAVGYRLTLAANRPGTVCFVLTREERKPRAVCRRRPCG